MNFLTDGGTTNDLTPATRGDPDYYLSFTIPFAYLVGFLSQQSISIDQNTPLQYVLSGTARYEVTSTPPIMSEPNPPPSDLEDCFQQVQRMALAAWQSYSFWTSTDFDLLYGDTLKKYGNFFYATHEAHLTMVVISLDCIFNCGKTRQDFRELVRLMREAGIAGEECDALIRRLDELETSYIKPIKIIRNHSFGHVLKYDQRVAMEQKHSPTQKEWMTLCYQSMVLVGKAGELLEMPVFNPSEMLDACQAEFQQIISKISDGEADQFFIN